MCKRCDFDRFNGLYKVSPTKGHTLEFTRAQIETAPAGSRLDDYLEKAYLMLTLLCSDCSWMICKIHEKRVLWEKYINDRSNKMNISFCLGKFLKYFGI